MTDLELLERFESATLDSAAFHHADHVRLAWLYLRERPLAEVIGSFTRRLKIFAASVGKPDRYHETITWALLIVVSERIARTPTLSWIDFARDNHDLLEWPSPVMKRYYREETLASDLARRTFVMPDRVDAAKAGGAAS